MVSIVGNNRDLGFDACNLFPLKNSVISVLNFSGSVPDISIVFFFFFLVLLLSFLSGVRGCG